MVCARPSGRFGITVTTTVDGKNVLEQTIVADGSPQPLSQEDCTGTYTSNWSRDGERLFTRVELECANRPKRNVSGITLLANGQWVDSQATIIDGNSDVRLRRYRRTSDRSAAAPAAANGPLSIEDVIEASAKVQSEALEAALDELNPRFALNSRVLTQLADNGVSRNVIDLMVAQAYPDKFQVERDIYASMPARPRPGSYGGSASVGSSSVYMGSSAYPYPMYTTRSTAATTTTRPSRTRTTGDRPTAIAWDRRTIATTTTTTYGFPGSGYYYGGGILGLIGVSLRRPDRQTRPAATASSSTDAGTRE